MTATISSAAGRLPLARLAPPMDPTTISTDWLANRARSRATSLALRDQDGAELTYEELYERALPLAGALGRGGTGDAAGVICAIELPPGLDHAVAVHAAMLAGRPFQTVRPGLPSDERQATLDHGDPVVVVDAGWLERHGGAAPRPLSPPPPAEATLSRVLTSGTSGGSRPVDLSYGNHLWSAMASAFNLGLDPDDRWLCCLPVDHVGGLAILIRSLIYGTAAVVHERFDADRVAAALEDDGVTVVSLVATQLRRLLDQGAPIERPRVLLVGGGPVPAELLDEALGRGANVVQTYGMTETCSQICTLSAADASRKRGSAGRPLLGAQVEIATGEIVVSGPMLAAGAAGDDGRLHTGDLGRLDEEGFLWVEGRRDDLIVTGGENVRPEDVEEILESHPAVAEAAVVGRPDPEWGSAVVAVVVAAPGHSPDPGELRELCRARLAPFKVPKSVELAESLPRTGSGKLQRRLLR
jgi:O-succinylbenzoic acid--CoA ligase